MLRTCDWYTEKKTMVLTTTSDCKSVIISGTILYYTDRHNIVKSTIIILILAIKY